MAKIIQLLVKFVHSRVLSLGAILVLFTAGTLVQGGFYGGNCPPKAAANSKVSLSCQVDCRLGHNALYGHCGEYDDFNCYCTEPLKTPSPRPLQCVDKTNTKYDDLCRIDCLCNHAATYWKCDYETHACHCWGQNPEPEKNDLCPYKCLRDMVLDLNAFELPNVKFGVPPKCMVEKIPIAEIPF